MMNPHSVSVPVCRGIAPADLAEDDHADKSGGTMNTRTIAVIALIIAVIVVLILVL